MKHYLIYVSTADHLMSESELTAILDVSRQWNSTHGLTGMLIYIEGLFAQTGTKEIHQQITGRFMQVLEGAEEDVEEIFSAIQTDARHNDIIILANSPLSSRNFESWQMGFKSLTLKEFEANPGYFNLNDSFVNVATAESSNPALLFLKSFYQRGMAQSTLHL